MRLFSFDFRWRVDSKREIAMIWPVARRDIVLIEGDEKQRLAARAHTTAVPPRMNTLESFFFCRVDSMAKRVASARVDTPDSVMSRSSTNSSRGESLPARERVDRAGDLG